MFLVILLATITVAVCIQQLVSFRRLRRYVERELENGFPKWLPKVAVILPCKGLDPGFRENMLKLLGQDYVSTKGHPAFTVIFSVASREDPAYPALLDVCSKYDASRVKLVVAGIHPCRSQKINNQLHALEHVGEDAEVLAFVDSDVIARHDFLRYLVAPLQDPLIGVTTGYRFYISKSMHWASILRSLWNRMSAWEMASPAYAFAWGGAMAIRRDTFEKARVAAAWDMAADDDLSLTTAIRRLGLRVHFVPQCLVASDGDGQLPEIFEWMNRQLILTKVYFPRLWLRAIFRASIMAVWLLAVVSALLLLLWQRDPALLPAAMVGLALLPIEIFALLKAQSLWQRVLSDQRGYLRESLWHFCRALPLAHLLLPWMTLYSLVTNRIQWRGVTYELKSPSETVVIS